MPSHSELLFVSSFFWASGFPVLIRTGVRFFFIIHSELQKCRIHRYREREKPEIYVRRLTPCCKSLWTKFSRSLALALLRLCRESEKLGASLSLSLALCLAQFCGGSLLGAWQLRQWRSRGCGGRWQFWHGRTPITSERTREEDDKFQRNGRLHGQNGEDECHGIGRNGEWIRNSTWSLCLRTESPCQAPIPRIRIGQWAGSNPTTPISPPRMISWRIIASPFSSPVTARLLDAN